MKRLKSSLVSRRSQLTCFFELDWCFFFPEMSRQIQNLLFDISVERQPRSQGLSSPPLRPWERGWWKEKSEITSFSVRKYCECKLYGQNVYHTIRRLKVTIRSSKHLATLLVNRAGKCGVMAFLCNSKLRGILRNLLTRLFVRIPRIMYPSNRSFNIPSLLATPRAFEFLENFCSNSPLPGLKSCSNAPTRTCLRGRSGGLFHWQRLVIAPRK